MFSAASPESVGGERQDARHRLVRRVQRLAVAACRDVAESVLNVMQAACCDRVHLACHLVAQQASDPGDLTQQGVD